MKQASNSSQLPNGSAILDASEQAEPTESDPVDPSLCILPSTVSLQKPRVGVGRSLVWAFSLVAAAGVSAVVGAGIVLFSPISAAIVPDSQEQFSFADLWQRGFRYQVTRPINILVMGIDRVPGAEDNSEEAFSGRSDTMLLVHIDPVTHSVSMLSIPRDTQIEIPSMGLTKINHANAIGGPALAAQVVSDTLNGVEIDRYVRISTDAFKELVDLVGGVEVDVPARMYYVDQTQKLTIDLQPGQQVLDGEQAEQFARFRSDEYGDIGRVQRQQQLIRSLRERLTSPAIIPKIPQAIQLLQDHLDTNLSLEEILALANFGLDLERENFRMVMLPGRFSSTDEYIASYWIMDTEGRDRVMQDYFEVGTISEVNHRSLYSLRIAVQNASGQPQVAREVAAYLEDQGFDNVYVVRDTSEPQSQTQIIVQSGDLEGASRLEDLLGMGQVVPASTGDLGSDLTIRVGEDWMNFVDLQQLDS